MNNTIRLFLSGLVIFGLFLGYIPTVLAHEQITSYLPTSFHFWKTYGSPTVTSQRVTLDGAQRGWVTIDLDARDLTQAYFAIAAYADKNDNRSNYTFADRNRSGNPYIYGYYLDANGKIIQYLTGKQTLNTTRLDADQVVYGVFPTLPGTQKIRIFLDQSGVAKISNAGVQISFIKPILFQTSSSSKAKDIIGVYANQQLSLNYNNTAILTGTQSSTSSNLTRNCASTPGTTIFKIGFEPNEPRDPNLQFGSSIPAWAYGVHNFNNKSTPYNHVSDVVSFSGTSSLYLNNWDYGYVNGQPATSPQLYDEAFRYVATNKLEKDARYAFSIRTKFVQGTSNLNGISMYLSQETGKDGEGQIVNTKLIYANKGWTCQEYQFTNREANSTIQDLVVFFGNLPKEAQLHIDDIQLIKR